MHTGRGKPGSAPKASVYDRGAIEFYKLPERKNEMAWTTINHSCGHTSTVQLYGPGKERDRTLLTVPAKIALSAGAKLKGLPMRRLDR